MSDHYGSHSSGNLISDGKNTCSYTSGTTGAVSRDPLLYTQAQVDALVKAAKEQAAKHVEEYPAARTHKDVLRQIAVRIRGGK